MFIGKSKAVQVVFTFTNIIRFRRDPQVSQSVIGQSQTANRPGKEVNQIDHFWRSISGGSICVILSSPAWFIFSQAHMQEKNQINTPTKFYSHFNDYFMEEKSFTVRFIQIVWQIIKFWVLGKI